ncbi:MAG: beta-N-acetylhexosaminidase [Gammaproteobacteria bacterium]
MSLGPVMVGIEGTMPAAEEREMLAHPLVGGVLLFSRNYESPAQLAELCSAIHALRQPPLLIAVDHEGGRVQRFHQGFTLLPAVAVLGRIHDRDPRRALHLAQVSGWLMAVELRSAGVDLSFAPVLDLDRGVSRVIGERAFHRDPEVVAELAHRYMMGMRQAGMAATGKHFPGHGAVHEDSHCALPVDQRRPEDILVEDLLPFERMIHYGMEALMTAHVRYVRADSHIASFSPFWIQEVLRRRLDFQGVVFSDDLAMAAAAGKGADMAQRARSALAAGCDMILVCQEQADAVAALDGLGEWRNPVAQLRLARMHGQHALTREELTRNPRWQEAVALVTDYDEPHTLELI